MSDSEKLRKIKGNIWLTISFIPFTIAICAVWLMFITYYGFILMVFGTVPLLFFTLSLVASTKSYETYVSVNSEEINRCNSAKLKKINGISELICAYVFLALAISTIWAIFIFTEIASSFWGIFIIALAVFIGAFYGFVIVAVNNFMAIDRCVKGKTIKSKHRGGLLTVHSSPSSIIPPPSKK